MPEAASFLISDGCQEWGNWVHTHNFFDSGRAQSMDARHSIDTNGVTNNSYGDGKQASEGVVVIWV